MKSRSTAAAQAVQRLVVSVVGSVLQSCRRRVAVPALLSVSVFVVHALCSERTEAAPGAPPNIVYIMADELGYYELSLMGHSHFKTPNIDRMAKEGVRFTQALAGSSLCAPTRCVLMTGKHTGHTSVRTNGGGTPLRAEEPTVASMLKEKGYATGGFGKWGCGGRGSTGVPEEHGFDTFFGYYDQVHAHTYYPPYLIRNSEEIPLKNNHGLSDGETYSQYEIVDAAKQFIRKNKDRPFFCYMPITPPHGLFDIPDDDPAWAVYKDKDWPEPARRYAAMVHMVDRQVGDVFALLDELKLDENTIVFFCGDNGGKDYFRDKEHPRGFHAPNVDPKTGVEFRGEKGKLYEGGLRIPMIVRWPGKIEPGRVSDHLWYFPDVLPTLAEISGADAPDDVDGFSIVPELLGERAAGRKQPKREFLYWELGNQTAIRMGDWKAVRPRKNVAWELYDLTNDVSETKSVADAHPDVLKKVTAFAKSAHTEAEEGVFHDRAPHEKDRLAKFGGKNPPAKKSRPASKVNVLPKQGLISNKDWKVVRSSSESRVNGKLAENAIDGDPRTHWHTRWQGETAKHPHEIVIDLGGVHTIRGFRYLARQDSGWNGTIGECEFSVADEADGFDNGATKTDFEKTREPQEVKIEPIRGRFVRLRILKEVGGGPWASIAELGVVGVGSE